MSRDLDLTKLAAITAQEQDSIPIRLRGFHDRTIVITLGRGTKNGQLGPSSWAQYKLDVQHAIECTTGTVLQRPRIENSKRCKDQVGEWQGTTEEAATFVLTGTAKTEEVLRNRLPHVAHYAQQEAIGFIVAHGVSNVLVPG